MPPKCYICKVYDPKRMKLFRIPDRNDEYNERSGLWLKLLDEKSVNVDRIRICSDHFLNSKVFFYKKFISTFTFLHIISKTSKTTSKTTSTYISLFEHYIYINNLRYGMYN